MPGFDWNLRLPKLLDQDSEISTDVVFVIEEDGERPGQGQEVAAHRIVMGMVCVTFKNMLFVTDTEDKTSGRVVVKETTADAFRIMINAIYKTRSIEEALQHKTVKEVFSVLDLVTKYDIPELLEDVRKVLSSFPLTDTSLLEVATDAMTYTILFEEEANRMLLHCAKYLRTKIRGEDAILQYLAVNIERQDVAVELLFLMKNLKMTPCRNCQQEPCQDGQQVLQNQFRVGLQVTWGLLAWGEGEVTEVTWAGSYFSGRVKLIERDEGPLVMFYSPGQDTLFRCGGDVKNAD